LKLTVFLGYSHIFWTLPDLFEIILRRNSLRDCCFPAPFEEAPNDPDLSRIFWKRAIPPVIRLGLDTLLIILAFGAILTSGQSFHTMTHWTEPNTCPPVEHRKPKWNPQYKDIEIKFTMAAICLDLFVLLVDFLTWYNDIQQILDEREEAVRARMQLIVDTKNKA